MSHKLTEQSRRTDEKGIGAAPEQAAGAPVVANAEGSAATADAAREKMVQGNSADVLFPVSEFARVHGLSPMEEKLVTLILSGVHLKEAAFRMGCSYSTLRTHAQRLSKKFGCSGLLQLLAYIIVEMAKAGQLQSRDGSAAGSSPAPDSTTTG